MSEPATTAPTTGTVTSTDGTVITFERTGSGPAIVLVDGALCSREFGPGRDVAKQLEPDHTVFVYDRRGRGQSGNTLPYAAAREVEDLQAVILAAGAAGDVYVVGQSSGAALSLEAAAAGTPMKKLAVYEAPYIGATDIDRVAELRRFLAADDNGGAVGYFLVKMVGAPAFLPIMMKLMPKVWNKLKAAAPTLPYDAVVMGSWVAPKDRFAKICVPTLVMGGTKGKQNMKNAVTDVAAAVAGSTLHWLPKQTHNVSPVVLAEQLRTFFADPS
ncbi:MAG: alpha/beta hydrolase [Microbacteriaceae bacterium]|nr:alpha/beta hydrolase [Microbacteriaceae bacterium]